MTRRLVIVEGPDASGKSTLTAFLGAALEAPTKHVTSETGGHLLQLQALALLNHPRTIFDRFHVSEQIYGPVYRGGPRFNRHWNARLEEWLYEYFGAVMVMCLPPLDVAKQEWEERVRRGKEKFSTDYERVWNGYASYSTLLPVIHYDYTKHDKNSIAAALRCPGE